MVSTDKIKELRGLTGAGVMDCKKALVETEGDIEAAIQVLRERGWSKLQEKAGKVTKEGMVDSYIHAEGKIGVLLEVNCETDFVAKNKDFRDFVHNLALHITASNPLYISEEDISQEDQFPDSTPEDDCLLEQAYVKDPEIKVKDYLAEIAAKIGENIVIRRFVRYELGKE